MGIITLPVINTPLDSEYITRIFNQISDVSCKELPYISSQTRESLKNYQDNKNEDNAKKIWKDLLIDSICLLKINDAREKLYKDTVPLIEDIEKFSKEFSKIRQISTYGIDELSDYFSDFIDFESVLYGTGNYYRDHIHHVLQVWGLGVGLLLGSDPITIKLGEEYVAVNDKFHFQIDNEKTIEIDGERYCQKSKGIAQSELWAIWCIISLCHDLGYPLEKASQINKKVKKIINHFGCFNFNELNYNFDILNTFIVEKYLHIISSKTVVGKVPCCNEDGTDQECLGKDKDHNTKIQHKYHDKFSKSLEDYDHGAFSGLLLFKKLTYFLETDYAPDKETLGCEDLRQFYIRKEILRAICGHTCPKIYHLDLNTLSFLLIFCDELQEWGRPRFSDLLSVGAKSNEQKITIDKFNTKDSGTEAHVTINFSNIKITDLNRGTYEEHIVRRKFKNFHYLLRSAKDDSSRKVEFTWKIKFENAEYALIFNSKKSSYEMFESTSKEKDLEEQSFTIYEEKNK